MSPIAAALLLACTGPKQDSEAPADTSPPADTAPPADTSPPDADGDGVSADEDCDDDDPGVSETSAWYLDYDRDGHGDDATAATEACGDPSTEAVAYVEATGDCDDTDPAVHPDAQEVCDDADVDEDCDGAADDADEGVDATTRSTWHADGDGDGHGDPTATTEACDLPGSGWTSSATDCDDDEAEVNPAATEVCDDDDVDEDCDGASDDDDPGVDASTTTTWHLDNDGDSYGDADTTVAACDDPSGPSTAYTVDGTDCDDGDAGVNPGATEVCDDDDVDEDCDGASDDDDPGVDAGTLSRWYADADADGHGDPVTSAVACDPPGSGWASSATDCDDGDAAVSPTATEVCDDEDVDEDCDGTSDDEDTDVDLTTGTAWYLDGDLDGYGDADSSLQACGDPSSTEATYTHDATDCDDGDGDVSPAASEVCDASGTDEDCNGLADDADSGVDLATATTWYADLDGDGYGAPAPNLVLCEAPSGWVDDGTDCDDDDPSLSPGATEVCDDADVDEDCDGLADDDDDSVDPSTTSSWYGDDDGDGYGGTVTTTATCDLPGEGWHADAEDCDDSDATVAPGAEVVCEDGVVNDCDGSEEDELAVCSWPTSELATDDADGSYSGSPIPNAFAAWDSDGDGQDEAAIGSPYDDGVYFLHGAPTDGAITDLPALTGASTLGWDVAAVGDVQGDGFDDLLLSTYARETDAGGQGTAWLVSGPLVTGEVSSVASASWDALDDELLGVGLSGAGDLDGDGYGDLLVGAPAHDNWSTASGAVYVFSGLDAGQGDVDDAIAVVEGDGPDDLVGQAGALTRVGDLDGDGQDDLVFGSPYEDGSGSERGGLYLFYGPLTSWTSVDGSDGTIYGETDDDMLGVAVEGGHDLDGDGTDDVVAGSMATVDVDGEGCAYMLTSVPESLSWIDDVYSSRICGDEERDYLGATLDLGDADGDGNVDLLAGSGMSSVTTGWAVTYGDAGVSWLFLDVGDGSHVAADAEVVFAGDHDYFGTQVGLVDVDDDGRDEVFVAQSYDSSYGGSYVWAWMGGGL